MVKGLEIFKQHFRPYADRYVLIGGTACDLAMNKAGIEFRLTKDLDIVLCVESLDAAFVKAFWKFVRAGGYEVRQKATGSKQFYRFQMPATEGYPFMLELFSRKPDSLHLAGESRLTPIPMEEEMSSLSAILMDDDYYRFLFSGKKDSDGLSFVGPEHLVPLKARAWLELSERKSRGGKIDSKSIKKHKNDVFRLYRILDPEFSGEIPGKIKDDLKKFISQMETEKIDLKSLGLGATNLDAILLNLRRIYDLD